MIDYVKIAFKNIETNHLVSLPQLDFKTEVSEKTGELSTKKVSDYHFCKITIYDSGTILFTGSIHKFWNSLNGIKAPNHKRVKQYKGFNGNLFTFNNIIEVRNHLEKLFNCTPQQMIFQNIEFGINTTPEFNPNLYLKGLLYHKNKMFEYRYNHNLAQAPHQRYIFKIYNKSFQYDLQNYSLRIELKIIKTTELKKLQINTFADTNINTLNKAKEMLLKRFDEVMHYDYTIKKKSLTNRQIKSLNNYSNPRFWINNLQPQHRDRHKKKLLEITRNNSQNLHQKIRQNLIEKCVIINRFFENPKCVIINSSSIGLNITHSPIEKTHKKENKKNLRICRVTGVNISMQKEGSFLLSHSGLKHYFKTDIKVYEKVKFNFLSKKWIDADFEIQIRELAHNIRNKHNNYKINRELKYIPSQKQLFN